jgi:hypothetical protein
VDYRRGLDRRGSLRGVPDEERASSIEVVDDYPVLRVRFGPRATDEAFEAYLERLEALLAAPRERRSERIAILLDASRTIAAGTPSQRRMQAEWLDEMRRRRGFAAGDEPSVGLCFVLQRAVVRGGLTAVLWLTRLRSRIHVVATEAEGEAWCRAFVAGEAVEDGSS